MARRQRQSVRRSKARIAAARTRPRQDWEELVPRVVRLWCCNDDEPVPAVKRDDGWWYCSRCGRARA